MMSASALDSPFGFGKPHFSGHETFALRYGWLKKAYDTVLRCNAEDPSNCTRNNIFGDGAVAQFGVGKNMVSAIRYWSKTVGIIEEDSDGFLSTTKFGNAIFHPKKGWDPYMENPATLWLVHWKLASATSRATTWYWTFSHFARNDFDREYLINSLMSAAADYGAKASLTTIKNDVGCFLNFYAPQAGSKGRHEDTLECPLIELELIKSNSQNRYFFARGAKPTLKDGVFSYALSEFWLQYSPNTATLSLQDIVYAPGSPGRVFLLQEQDVEHYLESISTATKGAFEWAESTGLRQVSRNPKQEIKANLSYVKIDFASHKVRRAA